MSDSRSPRFLDRERIHARAHRAWPHDRGSRHRLFFLRFLVAFGLLALLLAGGIAALAFVIARLLPGGGETPTAAWVAAFALILLVPILGRWQAARAYRGLATPLADIIDAADAVAQGKLDARVPEDSPGDLGRLARTFNRMVRELDLSDQRRRNLMADVAHELRTPLHILQGNLEGLLDGVYQPTPEQVSTMLDETRRLGRLVEDLRTLSLAEAGQLSLHKEPVAVAELLSDLGTSFGGLAEAAGVDFRVESSDDVSNLTLVADIGRLHQIFGNLILNALRHTPAGGTVRLSAVSCQPTATEGQEGMSIPLPSVPSRPSLPSLAPTSVVFAVSDTGPGISPEELPHIFDRYWRADREGSASGSGLGLAIARQLVELHGGSISATGEPGRGTTFTVELPVRHE